jgi:hypothetical protein
VDISQAQMRYLLIYHFLSPPFFLGGGGARGFSFGEKFRQNEKEIKITSEYYFAISPLILKAIANFGKKNPLKFVRPRLDSDF